MPERLADYLAGLYAAGHDKRADDDSPNFAARRALAGAGLGSLAGLARYALMDDKQRRRSDWLSNMAGGGLLGAGAGAASGYLPGALNALEGGLSDPGKQGGPPSARARLVGSLGGLGARAGVAGLMGKAFGGQGVSAAALQVARHALFGDGTKPDSGWGGWLGRRGLDTLTGAVAAPGGGKARLVGGLVGSAAGVLSDRMTARLQNNIDEQADWVN